MNSSERNTNQNSLEFSIEGIIPGIPKNKIDKDIFKIFGEAISNYEEIMNCEKLKENELTEREDLFIEIETPMKINPGGICFSYYQYTIKTNPIGYNVIRKLSDIELLYEIIPNYNKTKFNPLLPKFQLGLNDDSEKKLLFLRFYLNSLVEDPYYRSLPIVFDFFSLPQNEWNKKSKEYKKKKEIKDLEKMVNIEGSHYIKISNEEDFQAMRIKDNIKIKDEAYNKLNDDMDELLPIMEKMSVCLKNISQDLLNLKNIYYDGNKSTEILGNCFEQLNLIIKEWGENYIKQKNYLKNEFKYFFKYINKELNSFLKNIELYENVKEEYEKKFMKFQKMPSPEEKDEENIIYLKKLYGLHLVHVIDEYKKLNERQGKRTNKKFISFNKGKEIILQDYNNFNKIFNIKQSYNLPDVYSSYLGKQSDILNLNASKISKKSHQNRYSQKEETEERIIVEEKEDIENKERKEEKENIENKEKEEEKEDIENKEIEEEKEDIENKEKEEENINEKKSIINEGEDNVNIKDNEEYNDENN